MKFHLNELLSSLRVVALAACGIAATSSAQAAYIQYTVNPLGGDLWKYDYTVVNDSPAQAFDEFTIYFDSSLYDTLSIEGAASGWDPIVGQADLGIPADGFYDALRLDGLMPVETLEDGFSVSFRFLSSGTPGAQPFDLLNSSDFSLVSSGMTVLDGDGNINPVPEPSTYALLIVGLLALGAAQMRRNMFTSRA